MRDLPKTDEWPNLAAIERPKFPDGDPVSPLATQDHPVGFFAVLIMVIVLVLSFLATLLITRPARADEPSITIFEQPGECTIDVDLRVSGKKRALCVARLETATRLAKAEKMVNERRKK